MAQQPGREESLRRIRLLEEELRSCKAELKAMEEGEKWFSRIIRALPIATFVMDSRHRIVTCNKAHEKLTGLATDEIVGTDDQWKALYSEKRPVMADLILDNAGEDEIAGYYYGKYRKSKTIEGAYEAEDFFPALGAHGKWIFFTAAPLKDADGNITGALETLQDITEQKRAVKKLIESERRLRTLFDFVPYPIVVFTRKGTVYYLNPAFTEMFGWTFRELEGGTIPYDPPDVAQDTGDTIGKIFQEKSPLRFETRRMTKEGDILDVVIRMAAYADARGKETGVLMILRDVTREKREARNRETMHRISLSLPAYPKLEALLDFISREVRDLLGAEGAIVTLRDEERDEIFILGAAYEDPAIEKRAKELRFPMDALVAGRVIQTGKPIIVEDASQTRDLYRERDRKLGYRTRNLVLVPLQSSERIIGVLVGINKKKGAFEQRDVELLNTIGGNVALSIENARYSDELQRAYREVRSLNRAKDKVIHHLSHELKTPVAVLSGSLSILTRRLAALPDTAWQTTVDRARRNLNRIVEIQDEVSDIIGSGRSEIQGLLSRMLDQCADELETLIAGEVGETGVMERIRERIDAIYGPKNLVSEKIPLEIFVGKRLDALAPRFSHRELEIERDLSSVPAVFMPRQVLGKIVDGLVRNAVENTPDGGTIEVSVCQKGKGAVLMVRDFGVGIPEDARKRIFEGFFTTGSTMDYSSRRPFDFNAGGKGADLLRMKIFSERYGFKIDMASSRCRHLAREEDACPAGIADCPHCALPDDCLKSGGTAFTFYFPPGGPQ